MIQDNQESALIQNSQESNSNSERDENHVTLQIDNVYQTLNLRFTEGKNNE